MFLSFIIIAENKSEILMNTHHFEKIMSNQSIEFEVITSIGNNPSYQRNKAAEIAKGEWLYFLDNDSELNEETIEAFKTSLKKFPESNVFGGPSVTPYLENNWQKVIQYVFSSDFGIGPLKSRYFPNGNIRKSDGKELILCNLITKRDLFKKLQGFNENLYPNEENEFLHRISKTNSEVVYSPTLIVYKRHRESFQLFVEQIFCYGKGRTKHFIYTKNIADLFYFMPSAFLILNLVLLSLEKYLFISGLLLIYLILLLFHSIIFYLQDKNAKEAIKVAVTFIACHSSYSLGQIIGILILTKKKKPKAEVALEFSSTLGV